MDGRDRRARSARSRALRSNYSADKKIGSAEPTFTMFSTAENPFMIDSLIKS